MFNLFRKKQTKPSHRFEDLVFVSQAAKQAAIIAFAKQEPLFIFIAWFDDTASQFRQLFVQEGLDENRIEDAKNVTVAKYTGRQMAFLEHYPLRAKEEALVQHCSQQKFTVYNALTEPLFTQFGGERIIELMRKMGMNENEPLQHQMISHSLEKAQAKIAEKVALEQTAASPEAWMRKNVNGNKTNP